MPNDFYNFTAGIVVGEYLYFSSIRWNALYRRSLINGNVEFVGVFAGEDLTQSFLHKGCGLWRESIVFFPETASHIHLYNIREESFESIPFDTSSSDRKNADSVLMGDRLYLFPMNLRWHLLCLDLGTRTMEEITGFSNWCRLQEELHKDGCVFSRNIVIGDSVYLGVYQGNAVIEYDCKQNACNLIRLPVSDVFSVFRCGSDNWIVTLSGDELFKMDETWKVAESFSLPKTEKKYSRRINELLQIGNSIYALPAESERILKMYVSDNCFKIWDDYPDEFEFYGGENIKFFRYAVIGEKAFLFSRDSNAVLLIDEKEDKLEIAWKNDFDLEKYWEENPDHLRLITFKDHLTDEIHYENSLIGLGVFLNDVKGIPQKLSQ